MVVAYKKIIEGVWDCSSCGTKAVRGRLRECPNCGKPRGEDTKFYLVDDVPIPEEEKAGVSLNPDWKCGFCGSLNNDEITVCPSCSHNRDEEDLDYFAMGRTNESRGRDLGDDGDFDENSSLPNRDLDKRSPKKAYWNKWTKGGAVAIGVVLLVLLLVRLFTPTTATLPVVGKEWNRSVEVQEYRLVDDSDWSLPRDAELRYTRNEIRTYARVFSHYETVTDTEYKTEYRTESRTVDLGNGYFGVEEYQVPYQVPYTVTRQEAVYDSVPVYDTKYYYSEWRWVYGRSVSTSGEANEPYWGDLNLSDKERESRRTEEYRVFVKYKEKEIPCDLEYEQWTEIYVDRSYEFDVYLGSKAVLVVEETTESPE